MKNRFRFLNFGNTKGLLKIFSFFLFYALFKFSSYISPILMSKMVSKSFYGQFEYSLSIGVLLGILFDMGLSSSYPFFFLKKKEAHRKSLFHLYIFGINGFLLIFFSILYYSSNIDNTYYIAILIAIIWQNQVFFSSEYKSENNSFLAILSESSLYLVLNILLLVIWVTGIVYSTNLLIILFTIQVFLILFLNFNKIKNVHVSFSEIITLLKESLPFLLNSFLMILIANSTKILIMLFCTITDVADYSILLRISYLILPLYQMFYIYFFSKVYSFSNIDLDNWFFKLIILLSFANVAVFLATPFFKNYFPLLDDSLEKHLKLYIILCSYTVFWVISALNEGVIGREGLLRQTNISISVFTVVLFLIILTFDFFFKISMDQIIFFSYIGIFLIVQIQFFWLRKHNILLKKMNIFTLLYLLSTILFFLNY